MSTRMTFALPRRAVIALAALAGLAALWGGLARLGWNLSRWDAQEVAWHGALAVLSFLGTLIAGALALLVLPSPMTGEVLFLIGVSSSWRSSS